MLKMVSHNNKGKADHPWIKVGGKIFHDNRGVALVVVILLVSIMVGLTVELNRASRNELYETANLSDGVRLYYIAKSGFNGAEALLMADTNNYDALTENWAKLDILSLQSETFFRKGSFQVKIVDETGKVPINKLITGNAYNPQVKGLLMRLLSMPEFNLDESKVNDIVDSIKDWLDKDEEVTGQGAESSYYQSLANPYLAKNGFLDCIDELLMVKGMTKELYYGTEDTPPLKDFLTVYSDGAININTAPILVLRALAKDMTLELAEKMDEYRRNVENNVSDVHWYRKITGMENMNMYGFLSIKSNYFTIFSVGLLGKMRESVIGTIKKGQAIGTADLLSWQVE